MFDRICRLVLAFTFPVTLLTGLLTAPAVAGTTGGLRGRVVDQATGAGLAGAVVTATSPSQTQSTQTDASGNFNFLSLAPDTYVVSAELKGYDAASAAGVSVLADQVQSVGSFTLAKTLRTIGAIRSRSSSGLVRPGTTSDVYSVNASQAAAAAAVGGPGGLNQAYSAIATVPGANVPQGQQGWNQLVYIRGGDYSDVANELDGIPVQRASDYAPITTLSSLGQQEVQTYTGGTPPSAEASGLSGFINQVIKTGSYPGYENADLGLGGPAFYHKLAVEASGATNNRNFTYYIGLGAENQDYRYSDQFNGASQPLFFYPLYVSTGLNGQVYDGSGPAYFSGGQSYAIADTTERDNVFNFHFALPHKGGNLKDDIQLLFVNSDVQSGFYSSVDDLGGENLITQAYGGPATFTDAWQYRGPLFTTPNPADVAIAYSPSAPTHTAFTGVINPEERDADDHGASILKLQYQKNFSSSSYLRIFGYSEYNDWFLNGPVSAFLTYGGELQDYEVHGNDYGVTANYSNQLNSKNLLTVTGSYLTQKLETYSGNDYQGSITTNLVDSKGNCYNPISGLYASCYTSFYGSGGAGGLVEYGYYGSPANGCPTPSLLPVDANCNVIPIKAGSPAAKNGAKYVVTNDGQAVQIDEITPFYSAASLADQYHPNERTTINVGLRLENFMYRLDDTVSGYPARQFWFDAYDREYSFGSSATSVAQCTDAAGDTGVNPLTGASLCTPGTNADLANTSPRTVSFTAYEPRLSFTYTVNPDIVLRGSYGRYAAPAPTSYQQYNVLQQDLPTFIGQFLPYGFNTPYHESFPSYSNNYDFSIEQHIKGTDVSYKLTPFYRGTQNQLANIPIGTQGVLDGLNVGRQRNYGIEFQIRKGDFDRNGFSGLLSYTFTRSRVTYDNFAGGSTNEIDNLNDYIRNYNAFTSACAGKSNTALCGATPTGVSDSPCYNQGAPDPSCTGAGAVANPYWNAAPQPLLDRTGSYTPYDILPAPFQGANGYETPDVVTAVFNYKHNKLSITPSLTFSSGSFYGSPLIWPGYDPTSCTAATTGLQADTTTCSNYLFIPDKYSNKFDTFGAFAEPSRLTANLQLGYEMSHNTKLTVAMTGLTDTCFQRGYAWDNPSTCVYAQLASNLLAPVGNFVTDPSKIPVQLAYPYGSWYNNSQTGFVGQKLPFGIFVDLSTRI